MRMSLLELFPKSGTFSFSPSERALVCFPASHIIPECPHRPKVLSFLASKTRVA